MVNTPWFCSLPCSFAWLQYVYYFFHPDGYSVDSTDSDFIVRIKSDRTLINKSDTEQVYFLGCPRHDNAICNTAHIKKHISLIWVRVNDDVFRSNRKMRRKWTQRLLCRKWNVTPTAGPKNESNANWLHLICESNCCRVDSATNLNATLKWWFVSLKQVRKWRISEWWIWTCRYNVHESHRSCQRQCSSIQ